jgi:hypothetical protein
MASEARIVANRRSAENPPRRHRGHGDDPQSVEEHGSDFTLGALSISVVRDSPDGHAESDLIMQNKANLQGGRIGANRLTGKGL